MYLNMDGERNFTLLANIKYCMYMISVTTVSLSKVCDRFGLFGKKKNILDHWLFECTFTVPIN